MNKNVIFIMSGALAVAIVVAMLVQAKLSPKGSDIPTTEILVAVKSLNTGTVIKKEDVKWKAWPEGSVFKGAIVKSQQKDAEKLDIYGQTLRRGLDAEEPVTTAAVVPSTKGGNFMSASLAPGMRAMAIKTTADNSVGGFAAPGDHVDVILTYQVKMAKTLQNYAGSVVNRFASQTVISNARVMAIDQSAKEGDREAKVGKTITLEVNKEQAEILALAGKMGSLSLSLRRIGDTSEESEPEHLSTDVVLSDVMQRLVGMQGNVNYVRMYNGASVQNVPVRSGQ